MSETPLPNAGLIRSLEIQSAVCDAMGSPFSGALLAAAARDAAAGGPTQALMSRWSQNPAGALMKDAVALRLLGALHDLALSGGDAALASAYPTETRAGDATAAWAAALGAISTRAESLGRFLDHEPQTNEARRSACLLPGFLAVAKATGLPMRIFELGASAGLNQLWDRYDYALGATDRWGPATSPVHIPTDWRGQPPPLNARIDVTERAACDRKPVDLEDAAARRRLRAYVWADQLDRLERLDAAIAVARAAGTVVESADAAEWTQHRVSPLSGAVTVLFHSVFWQYMPKETQAALTETIAKIGARATNDAPFAWLQMEPPPMDMTIMELRLTMWPGGEDKRLATVHAHGAWVDWTG